MKAPVPCPDAYTGHVQVKSHFSNTPGLTKIPRGTPGLQGYRVTNLSIVTDLTSLLRHHGLAECKYLGLFWAGSKNWTCLEEREKVVILVVELMPSDITKWADIDNDVKDILAKHKKRNPIIEDVCYRYYSWWSDNTDSDAEIGIEPETNNTSYATKRTLRNGTVVLNSDIMPENPRDLISPPETAVEMAAPTPADWVPDLGISVAYVPRPSTPTPGLYIAGIRSPRGIAAASATNYILGSGSRSSSHRSSITSEDRPATDYWENDLSRPRPQPEPRHDLLYRSSTSRSHHVRWSVNEPLSLSISTPSNSPRPTRTLPPPPSAPDCPPAQEFPQLSTQTAAPVAEWRVAQITDNTVSMPRRWRPTTPTRQSQRTSATPPTVEDDDDAPPAQNLSGLYPPSPPPPRSQPAIFTSPPPPPNSADDAAPAHNLSGLYLPLRRRTHTIGARTGGVRKGRTPTPTPTLLRVMLPRLSPLTAADGSVPLEEWMVDGEDAVGEGYTWGPARAE